MGQQREGILHAHLLYDVHLVTFSPPFLSIRLSPKAPKDLPHHLEKFLKKKTGQAWTIAISDEIGHLTLQEEMQKASLERQNEVLATPLVKLLMEAFPETTLMHIEDKGER